VSLHVGSYWSIETGEWSETFADSSQLVLAPADDSAVLNILTPFEFAPSWRELQAMANRHAPQGTVIEETSCGQFAGLRYEYVKDTEYGRAWLLTLGELLSMVNYSCDLCHRERDRELVDRMLSTLADRRA
jgi:hypothetical protein